MAAIFNTRPILFNYLLSSRGEKNFVQIFQHLGLQETISCTLVSKKCKSVIQKTPILQSAILNEYSLIFGSDFRGNALDFYIVGEIHKDPRCQKLWTGLLTSLVYNHHLLILDEESYTEDIPKDPSTFEMHGLPLSFADRLSFSGWDIANREQETGNSETTEKLFLFAARKHLKKRNRFHQKIVQLCPNINALTNLSLEKLQLYLHYSQLMKFHTKKLKEIYQELSCGPTSEARLKRCFPKRTLSMIQTIKSSQELLHRGLYAGKILIRCGASHAVTRRTDVGVPEFSLHELYQTLSPLRACVIVPKHIRHHYV